MHPSDLFGVPWDDLTLEQLVAFLAQAEPEPLVWGAKGTELDPHAIRRAAGAFANSEEGGCLILGAAENKRESRERRWSVHGVDFKGEATTWIGQVIADGLRPVPAFDVRTLELDDGRIVAVVWVPPVLTPPCIVRGTVFERMPGRTIAVSDPVRLHAMYSAGRAAQDAARTAARALCDEVTARQLEIASWGTPLATLGLRHVGVAEDVQRRLFSEAFADRFEQEAQGFAREGMLAPTSRLRMQQQGLTMWAEQRGTRDQWFARVRWDGSAALGYARRGARIEYPETTAGWLLSMWRTAHGWARELGGTGTYYVSMRVAGKEYPPYVDQELRADDLVHITRGPLSSEPEADDDEARYLQRELQRASGQPTWEPQ